MKTKQIYLVEWIEVEYGWGSRPEGFKCFDTLNEAKRESIKDSENGNYPSGGGYCGPIRPISVYTIDIDRERVDGKKFPFFLGNKVVNRKDLFLVTTNVYE